VLADCHNGFKINTISIYESQLRFLIGGKKASLQQTILSLSSNNSFSKQHEPRVKREQKKERALELFEICSYVYWFAQKPYFYSFAKRSRSYVLLMNASQFSF